MHYSASVEPNVCELNISVFSTFTFMSFVRNISNELMNPRDDDEVSVKKYLFLFKKNVTIFFKYWFALKTYILIGKIRLSSDSFFLFYLFVANYCKDLFGRNK